MPSIDPPTACLAASPGGHLALLESVKDAFPGYRRVWVTGASSQADALRAAGEEVHVLAAWARDSRGVRGAAPNILASIRLARDERPAIVVTSGAGLVVPFALAARAFGSELVVMETMARVTDASLTGRILAPLARRVIVQWPEMRDAHRHTTVCRPALFEGPARTGARREDDSRGDGSGAGAGTFVSVGTRPDPFDRLLAVVDRAVDAGVLPKPVVAQAGASRYRPASYRTTAWMAPHEMEEAIARSRYVVCHAGAAILSSVLASGRRPMVLPRRKREREHRTEHQEQIVERLARWDLVVPVAGEITVEHVRAADEPPRPLALAAELPSVESVLRSEALAVLAALERRTD